MRIVASGGGLRSRVWMQVMSDVIGVPVIASTAPEASSRGAALLALKTFGKVADLDAMPAPLGAQYEPRREYHESYRRARSRQDRLYDLLIAPGPGVLTGGQ